MLTFKEKLRKKITDSLYLKLGASNHDVDRFGDYKPFQITLIKGIKTTIKRLLKYKKHLIADSYLSGINKYEAKLQRLFEHLNIQDRELLVAIIAFRILGAERVKLPRNNQSYWNAIETVRNLQDGNETHDPHFKNFRLHKFDLSPIGIKLKLLFTAQAIAIDFIIEQIARSTLGICRRR
jgi:hypothetical protein